MTDLHQAALDALRRDGNPSKALHAFVRTLQRRRDLLNALALDYLKRIGGHGRFETQVSDAAKPGGGDQITSETQSSRVAAVPAIKVKPYKVPQHRRRTHEQKQAAIAAWKASAQAIYEARRIDDKPIGDLKWRELRALIHDNAVGAVSHLMLGLAQTRDVILMQKIYNHATVSVDEARIRDIVGPEVLQRYDDEASNEAPIRISENMELVRANLERLQAGPTPIRAA